MAAKQHKKPAPAAGSNPAVHKLTPSLVAGLIVIAATIIRLWGLTSHAPVLTDEAIYMRWAEIIEHQGEWFISLLDGKQPLSYWIYALLRIVSDGDPLLLARAVSAVAGGLSAGLLFLIGKQVAGSRAGLLAGILWALFPWSLIYDRMVYAEALVNLLGLATVYTALRAFDGSSRRKWTGLCALSLAAAFLVKSTALLFVPAIALLAAVRPVSAWKSRVARLALILAPVAVLPFGSPMFMPEAPVAETHSTLLHHSSRFAGFSELAASPARYAAEHFPDFLPLVVHYFTWPGLLAALAAFAYLLWKRSLAAWLVIGASIVPLAFQLFVLTVFAGRFVYPHQWPWILAIAVALSDLGRRLAAPTRPWMPRAAVIAAILVVGSFTFRAGSILRDPQTGLHPDDAGRLFGSYVHAAWGVPEAIELLRSEARAGGFVLLTDPFWGVPADLVFAYLNQSHNIQMYEAWWTQVEGKNYPVMPTGEVEVFRSHYQRVPGGKVDFLKASRVYYITDTFYMPPSAMAARQPGAQLIGSFPKPDGSEAVNVYRLK